MRGSSTRTRTRCSTSTRLCLEVAEHIPQQYEDALLSNMHEHNSEGIVLSWSDLKPPRGNGHVNPRNWQWVTARLAKMGYHVDKTASGKLRNAAKLPWFKANVFVFRRIKLAIA